MRFLSLSCLLLLAAVQAHPEGSWKWGSSPDQAAPSAESTTAATNSVRVNGQTQEDDSVHLAVAGNNIQSIEISYSFSKFKFIDFQ